MEVYCSVASILFFRVDILSSSESVQFGTKMTRMEPDNKVELREIFGPLWVKALVAEILKVFMICNFLLCVL